MFKIVILPIIVAATVASPIYTGGMGYGGIGTSSVSVSRRTSVVSPGMYGGGMMTPGMGMGVYGTGMGLAMVDEKTAGGALAKTGEESVSETTLEENSETMGPNGATSETVVEKDVEVESPVEGAVEVMRNMDNQAPMGQIRAGVMGGMGMVSPGMMGAGMEAGSSRTDVVRAGMGGVERDSVGESHVNTPFGSKSTVSSARESSGVML